MTLGPKRTADRTRRKCACGRNWLWNDARLFDGPDRNVMLSAMAAVAANEDASILATSVPAATNEPLLLKLALGAWVIWPFKFLRHLTNRPNA